MEYVALEYRKQIQNIEKRHKEENIKLQGNELFSGIRKEDKIFPIIAVVLYFGTEPWDGSKCLYEMFDEGEDGNKLKEFKKYISDFQLNIIQAYELEQLEIFKTSLRHIFGLLKCSKDMEKLKKYMEDYREEIGQMDNVESLATLAILGNKKKVEFLLMEGKEEEGGIQVCKAIEDMIMEGREEGRKCGIAELNELIQQLVELGRMNDLIRSTTDDEYQRTLFEEFGIGDKSDRKERY